jgi:hypothetical protein
MDYSDPAAFFAAINRANPNLPIPEIKTAEDVRKQAAADSETIFRAYETLHEIGKRHEPTIQKRWTKKTRQQRLKLLLAAWPGMPAVHRSDVDAFHRESEVRRDAGTKYKDYYMWPHINQEDLSDT